ncbi:TauD/TfdA dioxygenase family protein [Caulobacter hibisci]|uniref:TauD/TfdA family dioxygenase n=1 Tax=Caulobacter hibisci TaxID=2035993 RepID=A0ABS0T3H1_9CAUL|nr:TauD/TfdA family dioxygenase [Caulobacter hibisci]MBI1686433.1 TauD/TfdA family dioxygenase [Caulobacter hibisci]
MVRAVPLHPLFAAEVSGVDLGRPLQAALISEIAAALDTHAVLVFRDQPLTNAQQIAFSERFGALEETVGAAVRGITNSRLGEPRIAEVSNLGPDGAIRAPEDRWRLMQQANGFWHTDSSFKPRWGKISFLSAHECPATGGQTEFADLRAAYDALDPTTKADIVGLEAVHSMSRSRGLVGYDELASQAAERFPPVVQPIARHHPGSGRMSLYLASHASHVLGRSPESGRTLLNDLIAFATTPGFVFQHSWRVGDLVMWDNRCTMHRGLPYDDLNERRDMRRTTVVETQDIAPFAEMAS